jgi:hypothetical protein
MAILHKIVAWLYKNPLMPGSKKYFIRAIHSNRTLDVKSICKSAVLRGGANMSASAMEHTVIMFLKEMGFLMCDGFCINTGWFTAGPQFRGVADSPTEQYDKEKHTLVFEFQQGTILRKEMENVIVEILGVAETGAIIGQITDVKTGSVNHLITPERNLKISGHKVKIVGDDEANGVYFVNQATGEHTKVDSRDIAVNSPSELIVTTPALATGTYLIEITTQFSGGGRPLNTPRTDMFDIILTVQ